MQSGVDLSITSLYFPQPSDSRRLPVLVLVSSIRHEAIADNNTAGIFTGTQHKENENKYLLYDDI